MNKRVHSAVKILGQDWINPIYDTAIEELMISKEMPQTFAENSYAQPSLQGKVMIHDRCLNNKSTSNPSAYHKYKKEQVCHWHRFHHWVKIFEVYRLFLFIFHSWLFTKILNRCYHLKNFDSNEKTRILRLRPYL